MASVLAFGGTACSPAGPEADGPSDAASAPEHPRLVLLLSLDALRPDHLGAYGYERFTSPNLDAVAREGVVFEDASATAPWTLPSHGSILTGLFPKRHAVTGTTTRLPSEISTLASMMGRAGYRTAAVVNIAWLKRESFQLTRDFDDYVWVEASLGRRTPSTWVTDQAIEWIEGRGDEPLFIFAHWYDVHSDYASEDAYEKLFVRQYDGPVDGTSWQLKMAAFERDYIEYCQTHSDPKACVFGPYKVDASSEPLALGSRDVAHLRDLYDASIRQLDTELGRLFTTLRKEGLYDDTLILVTSDHGQEFLEHGSVEHFITTYQESLRVPLLIRGPGIPRGLRVSAPVSSVDIAPTLVSLAGGVTPPRLDGSDLSPLLAGGDSSPFDERLLFAEASGGTEYNMRMEREFFPVFRSVRQGRYKLVHESKNGSTALYDLAEDPGETRDCKDEFPEIAAELTDILSRRHAGDEGEGDPDNRIELDPEDLERLRALGYVP